MAAPDYDFNDPTLKPWHLKATYQLYDYKGKPTEQGTYEHWCASPKVYCSTWTRLTASKTYWHSKDGNHSALATGESLKYFERNLPELLFSPLPHPSLVNSTSTHPDLMERASNGTTFPSISLTWIKQTQSDAVSSAPFSLYCFDPKLPDLRASMHGFNILTEFNNIAKVQGKFLVREILAFVEQQKMFTVRVEVVEAWNVADSALTHAPGATLEADLKDLPGDAPGQLVKKQQPVYPILAMATRRQGTVVLDATIGIDGKVRDLNVIYDPTELFGAAALEAVSHWQYKPYLHNGEPVEVKTIINVFFRQNR